MITITSSNIKERRRPWWWRELEVVQIWNLRGRPSCGKPKRRWENVVFDIFRPREKKYNDQPCIIPDQGTMKQPRWSGIRKHAKRKQYFPICCQPNLTMRGHSCSCDCNCKTCSALPIWYQEESRTSNFLFHNSQQQSRRRYFYRTGNAFYDFG
jgi:hypothetical protein